jgi:hypothetical protein
MAQNLSFQLNQLVNKLFFLKCLCGVSVIYNPCSYLPFNKGMRPFILNPEGVGSSLKISNPEGVKHKLSKIMESKKNLVMSKSEGLDSKKSLKKI